MGRSPRFIVSLHDVHPGSLEQVRRQREDLQKAGVKQVSHLVVPEFHHQKSSFDDVSLSSWLDTQQSQGDELVLHGYYHDRQGQKESWMDLFWTRFYTNQEAEFYSLSPAESIERWRRGKEGLKKKGWRATGFVAPAWLLNENLIDPLGDEGFDYTVFHGGILNLKEGNSNPPWKIPTLCWSSRSGWRRQVSLIWNGILFQTCLVKGMDLRVSLHPMDIEYPLIWNQIMTITRQLIKIGYQPMTYRDYLQQRSTTFNPSEKMACG